MRKRICLLLICALLLFSLAGGVWWVILFSRWMLSAVIVWIARGVYAIRDRR